MSVPTSGRPSDTVLGWYDTARQSMDPWLRSWAAAADDAIASSAGPSGWMPTYAMPAMPWGAAPLAPQGGPSPWDWWAPPADPSRRTSRGRGARHEWQGHAHRHHEHCGCDDHTRDLGHDCDCERGHGLGHGHGHDVDCGCDPCRPRVVDADLVVTARPNERRIVPVELRNTWHRERTLTVELGSFTAELCGPDPQWGVRGSVSPTGEVTLAPCSCTTLEVVLEIGPVQEPTKDKPAPVEPLARATTFYADLGLAGCGRAQRLAVVVLPDRCGSHRVTPSACCC